MCSRAERRVKQGVACSYPPYAVMLNSSLPPDVRVVNWGRVPEGFNARFRLSMEGVSILFCKEWIEY